jgi:hypothetical protein
MTKTIREKILETAAVLCLTLPFSLMNAGERVDFIPVPTSLFPSPKLFCISERLCREERFPPSMNSNNLLAVELENENDAAR